MLDKNQALDVIKQALNVATMKGAFNLIDVQNILDAIKILETKEPDKKQ